MKKGIPIALALLIALASGCGGVKATRYQAQFLRLFDTVTTIVGYANSEAQFKEISEQVRAQLEQYHQLYDIYNDHGGINNIKTINDNAGIAPVTVDQRIIDLLLFARDIHGQTGGKVNVAMGPVLRLWHEYREAGTEDPAEAELPPMELLQSAAGHTSIEAVLIDEEVSTVYLTDPAMSLDVGAMAKGYALERIVRELEARGVRSLLLSVGGNVRAIGGKDTAGGDVSDSWTVAIQNPDKSGNREDLFSVGIDSLSVVSSGTYERYYTVDGVRYHHIIDPETLMPAGRFAQVTLLCPDSGLADALSTYVFNLSAEEGMRYIESLEDMEACWVTGEGEILYSSGFSAYIKASGKDRSDR